MLEVLVVLALKKEDKELYFSFTNYVTPGSIYKYNIKEAELQNYIENQTLILIPKITKANKCFTHLKTVQKYL